MIINNLKSQRRKHTPHYNLCVQTLKSDSSSFDADVKGLALIMVKVIKVKVSAIRGKIDQLLKSGHLEPKQEKALRSCDESNKIVMESTFPVIEGALKLGNPKFAEEGVVSIGIIARNCEEIYTGGTSPLAKENKALRDLAAVGAAIVRLLL